MLRLRSLETAVSPACALGFAGLVRDQTARSPTGVIMDSMKPARAIAVVEAHQRSGYPLSAGGFETFVLDRGDGPPVVCLHGVPASSFLYRKVVDELSVRGLRGIAFDLPGLGLADRPRDFDYSWTGLGQFAADAVDALGLDDYHLVVHDIGAPVGFELAGLHAGRVITVTVLNAPVAVATFRRPVIMKPFAVRGIGEIYLGLLNPPMFRWLMRRQAIADRAATTDAELEAYLVLLRRADHGRAFLKIMRSFELTESKQDLYQHILRDSAIRVQVVWGQSDPALPLRTRGEQARQLAGVSTIHQLPGKHFLQEDQAPALADLVASHVRD